eukprot:scaffold4733_cov170-Alexandrium_tamarense.AAC.37
MHRIFAIRSTDSSPNTPTLQQLRDDYHLSLLSPLTIRNSHRFINTAQWVEIQAIVSDAKCTTFICFQAENVPQNGATMICKRDAIVFTSSCIHHERVEQS